MVDTKEHGGVRTSKKFRPALYTSTNTWSGAAVGSGASNVRGILDGCAYFSIMNARMLEEYVVMCRGQKDVLDEI